MLKAFPQNIPEHHSLFIKFSQIACTVGVVSYRSWSFSIIIFTTGTATALGFRTRSQCCFLSGAKIKEPKKHSLLTSMLEKWGKYQRTKFSSTGDF